MSVGLLRSISKAWRPLKPTSIRTAAQIRSNFNDISEEPKFYNSVNEVMLLGTVATDPVSEANSVQFKMVTKLDSLVDESDGKKSFERLDVHLVKVFNERLMSTILSNVKKDKNIYLKGRMSYDRDLIQSQKRSFVIAERVVVV